ncbi:hypothetical protein KCU74_g22, partial [Aureobasidium melanogenum]
LYKYLIQYKSLLLQHPLISYSVQCDRQCGQRTTNLRQLMTLESVPTGSSIMSCSHPHDSEILMRGTQPWKMWREDPFQIEVKILHHANLGGHKISIEEFTRFLLGRTLTCVSMVGWCFQGLTSESAVIRCVRSVNCG